MMIASTRSTSITHLGAIFLLTTCAGGLGIDLVTADIAVLYNSWYVPRNLLVNSDIDSLRNPQANLQAMTAPIEPDRRSKAMSSGSS